MRFKKVICELCGVREVRRPQKKAEHHFCYLCGTRHPLNALKRREKSKNLTSGDIHAGAPVGVIKVSEEIKVFRPWYDESGQRVRSAGAS
jgi:transcription elongation factor Elf1